MTKLRLIAALDENDLIGSNGKLPWHCASDLAYFKKVTLGCNVVCGRLTAESLPPLPDRNKFVLTSNCPDKLVERGFTPLTNLDEFEGWVIGGAQVYKLALPLADELHITRISGKYHGDTWFPKYNKADWQLKEMILKPDCNIEILVRV